MNPRLAAILYNTTRVTMGEVTMGKPSWGCIEIFPGFATAPICVGFFHITSLKGPEILDSMMLRYTEAWLNIDHE